MTHRIELVWREGGEEPMMNVQTAEAPPQGAHRYQLESGLGRLTPAERAARGKEAPAAVPRDTHRMFDPQPERPEPLSLLEEICGWALARAHACSGHRIAIAAYLGSSDVFDKAITRFAAAYADQNERDHQSLVDAVASGRITAERDM